MRLNDQNIRDHNLIFLYYKILDKELGDWSDPGDCLPEDSENNYCGTLPGFRQLNRTCINGTFEYCSKSDFERNDTCIVNKTIDCISSTKIGIFGKDFINSINNPICTYHKVFPTLPFRNVSLKK